MPISCLECKRASKQKLALGQDHINEHATSSIRYNTTPTILDHQKPSQALSSAWRQRIQPAPRKPAPAAASAVPNVSPTSTTAPLSPSAQPAMLERPAVPPA
ncbi:hypothetical protein CVT26_005301 [Gymnopilus dilepis]|uniref:Uncharacterized protein n=1 Tax=Gymnopilus dilepis TaxID=231916 RepID=A0A409YST7_9AGAR|nr:hypothetical protein CVT26_005301 [Gymnopilus dilepis]